MEVFLLKPWYSFQVTYKLRQHERFWTFENVIYLFTEKGESIVHRALVISFAFLQITGIYLSLPLAKSSVNFSLVLLKSAMLILSKQLEVYYKPHISANAYKDAWKCPWRILSHTEGLFEVSSLQFPRQHQYGSWIFYQRRRNFLEDFQEISDQICQTQMTCLSQSIHNY
ncbi:hypothetical protein CEXT_291661 [Caerostris extrusa]|uniref:Uncharacterized protein n=1 Tax=Caerostris extrusa TaxID=172846 RepID=A0AAV4W5G6_CAEEX|nr:hypothetical protein CEXT_291661 [Caerostris extrusa]